MQYVTGRKKCNALPTNQEGLFAYHEGGNALANERPSIKKKRDTRRVVFLEVISMKVRDVIPYEKNPRQISMEAVEKVAA